MNQIEIWKDILEYEGLYQISNHGRVKRLVGWKCSYERILKSGDNGHGHGWVYLYKK